MTDLSYPFQEFSDHHAALRCVLNYEHVKMSDELVEVGKPLSQTGILLRMQDYLNDLHGDYPTVFYKLSRFMSIMRFAAQYGDELGIPQNCFDGTGLMGKESTPLFKAIHHFYAVRSMPEGHPRLEQVNALAQKYRADEGTA